MLLLLLFTTSTPRTHLGVEAFQIEGMVLVQIPKTVDRCGTSGP
jgi:hypothetical protein